MNEIVLNLLTDNMTIYVNVFHSFMETEVMSHMTCSLDFIVKRNNNKNLQMKIMNDVIRK